MRVRKASTESHQMDRLDVEAQKVTKNCPGKSGGLFLLLLLTFDRKSYFLLRECLLPKFLFKKNILFKKNQTKMDIVCFKSTRYFYFVQPSSFLFSPFNFFTAKSPKIIFSYRKKSHFSSYEMTWVCGDYLRIFRIKNKRENI